MHSGSPPVTAATTFRAASSAIARRVSVVALPICGAKITFG